MIRSEIRTGYKLSRENTEMKRLFLTIGIVAVGLFAFSNLGTEAVEQQFAERFVVNGTTIAEGPTGSYNFDKAHTFIGFRVKHMGLIDVPGFFRDFTGTVNYDPKDVSKSSVTFTAQMTSVDTGVKGRDDHLRRADFFEVEKFPEMTFKSTKVEKKGDSLSVTGDLTMKGVTKSVVIPFSITGFLPATERRGALMGVTGETMINRRDFGVNYGTNMPNGIPSIGDEIKVWLQIEAAIAPPAKPVAE